MQFEVTNRFTGAVQFVAEIECDENASRSVKLGLAVRWAVKTRANLSGANLSGARNIAERVIDGGIRSDGYRFLLTRTEPGEFRIKAGCRNLTVPEAETHWDTTRPKGDSLGDETRLIIKHMLAVAKLRKWKPMTEAERTQAEARTDA